MTRQAGGLVDVADVGSNSDWVTCTLAPGISNITGYALSYLVLEVGGLTLVFVRGRVDGLVAATNTQLTNSTGGALPYLSGVSVWELGVNRNSGTTKAAAWLDGNGHINARTDSGTQAFVFGFYVADV